MGSVKQYDAECKINTLKTDEQKTEFMTEFLKGKTVPKNEAELKDLVRILANELTDNEFPAPTDYSGDNTCTLINNFDKETFKTTGITMAFHIRTNDDYNERYSNNLTAHITPDGIEIIASKNAFYIWFVNRGEDDCDKETDSERFSERRIEFVPDKEFLKDLFNNFDETYKESRQRKVNIEKIEELKEKTSSIASYISLEEKRKNEFGDTIKNPLPILVEALHDKTGYGKYKTEGLVLAFDDKGKGFKIYEPITSKKELDDGTKGVVHSLKEINRISYNQFNEQKTENLFKDLQTDKISEDGKTRYYFVNTDQNSWRRINTDKVKENFELYEKETFVPDFKKVIDDVRDFYFYDSGTEIPLEENEGMSFYCDALLRRAIRGYDYDDGGVLCFYDKFGFIPEDDEEIERCLTKKEIEDFIIGRIENDDNFVAFNAYHNENGDIVIKAYATPYEEEDEFREDTSYSCVSVSKELTLTPTEKQMFKEAFDEKITEYEAMWEEEYSKTDI